MVRKLLLTASLFAVLASLPAFAETTVKTETTSEKAADVANEAGADIKRGWNKTKDAVSNAATDVSKKTEKTYDEIKATLVNKDDVKSMTEITIDPRQTAVGTIGKNVYNAAGEPIAKIHDIILDGSGNAATVILADGELFGMGKKVAFDYDVIVARDGNGDAVAPLSEKTISQAVEFSYDVADKAKKDVMIMPANGVSVARLLDAKLVDPKKNDIGDVENVAFQNGKANQLIVGFDKIMGVGGKKAVMAYSDATIVRDGDRYDLNLSANQASRLETYKKSIN